MNYNLELSNIELFPDGSIRSGFPKQEYYFQTNFGNFKAQHTNDDARKQTINSLEFFDSGNLRKISLEEQTDITTKHGNIPAELILFYDTKKIRKVFPLNGRITGYWSEKDEYKLAKELEFNIGKLNIKGKFINIEFYENETIKSMLLWPGETVDLTINDEIIKVKNRISFYSSGKIKSIEPAKPVIIKTPIGRINVINTSSSGLGYASAISFSENGSVQELLTSSEKFEVIRNNQLIANITPKLEPSMCNDKILIPQVIKIKFEKEYVYFDETEYELVPHEFLVHNNAVQVTNISCCS